MDNNDVLRRLRYALDIKDTQMQNIFKLSGVDISMQEIAGALKKDKDSGFVVCSDGWLDCFLDGLITDRRGPKNGGPADNNPVVELNNNSIFRKIRIALELKEEDLRLILKKGGMQISKSELSAFFRKKDHRNYKECGDQILRNFLKGLALHLR